MALKIIICGDSLVGKTTLRKKFFGPAGYINPYKIGYEFSFKDIVWEKGPLAGQKVKILAWEMSSEKQFISVRPYVYLKTNAALLVYDITNPQSFENLTKWIKEIITTSGNLPMVVIANKIDLKGVNQNSVPSSMGNDFAKKISDEYLKNTYKVPFVETSAKNGVVIPSKPIILPSNLNPELFYAIF